MSSESANCDRLRNNSAKTSFFELTPDSAPRTLYLTDGRKTISMVVSNDNNEALVMEAVKEKFHRSRFPQKITLYGSQTPTSFVGLMRAPENTKEKPHKLEFPIERKWYKLFLAE
jgi:hypothetical protein